MRHYILLPQPRASPALWTSFRYQDPPNRRRRTGASRFRFSEGSFSFLSLFFLSFSKSTTVERHVVARGVIRVLFFSFFFFFFFFLNESIPLFPELDVKKRPFSHQPAHSYISCFSLHQRNKSLEQINRFPT